MRLGILGLLGLAGAVLRAAEPHRNHYEPFPRVTNLPEGTSWPQGQALPVFATPADALDALEVRGMSPDEAITFSALQGIVNRKKPRILLLDGRANEGRDTWVRTLGLKAMPAFGPESKYEVLEKYADEVGGVILYDPSKSTHFRNLAGTAAGIQRALPVTREILDKIRGRGIELKVVEDLTGLELSSPVEIYRHLYERYWPNCEKRLLVSARPSNRGGDHHHTRDLAAAFGAAVVWLDNRVPEEKEVMRAFLGDMKAGEAVVLGWHASERSGITTASEFGIGTLPADHFVSASVYSGTDHTIRIPPVPKMPELENKAYVAIFISDGDNIQYVQHAMRQIWDRAGSSRGKVELNWTIAPGLVDIGPGLLNYYYETATPKDCFVAGPSGMGYMMPFNTLEEPGAPVGICTTDKDRMGGYARLTETYMQRSGLRSLTIWDDATPMQRQQYEIHGRQLYGATVQNFKDVPSVKGSVEDRRLRFEKLEIPYAGSRDHLGGALRRALRRWNGNSPLFLAYQVDVWGEMKPDRLVELHDELRREFGERVEFVRADHYFNLRNRAEKLPFNLAMAPGTKVRADDEVNDTSALVDGTPTTLWSSERRDAPWLGFDFGEVFSISRYVIRHAGAAGMPAEFNTRLFAVEISADGREWRSIDVQRENSADVTDVEFPPVAARYVKVRVGDPGRDGVARIADVEVYGAVR